MAVKAWKAKLLTSDAKLKAAINHTLAEWNRHANTICKALLAFRAGRFGEEGLAVWDHIRGGQQRIDLLYKITADPRDGADSTERQIAKTFIAKHGYLQSLLEVRRNFAPMWRELCKACRERVVSHEEKRKAWNTEHEAWLTEREEWESAHPEYMAIRPFIEQFERSEGQTGRRRRRWHRWLDFLQSQPALAAWRGSAAEVRRLTPDEVRTCAKEKRRAVAKAFELFFARNLELKALDETHNQYQRTFARPWAKRRNVDGFVHTPTFTLPSLPAHPDWPRLKANEAWKDLNLQSRTIRFRLLTPDGPDWFTVKFVPDPRLSALELVDHPVKEGKVSYHYRFCNSRATQPVFAQPQGIKLICREDAVFASISLSFQPAPYPIAIKQRACSKYSASWTLRKCRAVAPDLPLITCAVDLAVRHIGAITVAREGVIIARRLLHHRFSLPGNSTSGMMNIPTLKEIGEIKWRVRRARRKSGRISEGTKSCRRLQQHYRGLCSDRYKKIAAAIVSFAHQHNAHVVIFEDLKRLLPDAANERGVNRALQSWNRRSIVQFAQATAEDAGLRVVTVPAFFTSRICARCAKMGVRFNQSRSETTLHFLGHWFGCVHCKRRIHADLNGSENLHRVFLGTFPECRRIKGTDPPVYQIDGQEVPRSVLELDCAAWLNRDAVPF